MNTGPIVADIIKQSGETVEFSLRSVLRKRRNKYLVCYLVGLYVHSFPTMCNIMIFVSLFLNPNTQSDISNQNQIR